MKPFNQFKLWNQLHITVLKVERCYLSSDQSIINQSLPANTFMMLCRGKAHIYLNNKESYILEQGYLLHLPKGVQISLFYTETDQLLEYFLLSYRAMLPNWRKWITPVPDLSPIHSFYVIEIEQMITLYNILQKMEEHQEQHSLQADIAESDIYSIEMNKLAIKSLFYQFIFEFYQQKKMSQRMQTNNLAEQTMLIINRFYNEPLTLDMIGQKLGYHSKYLARKFKQETGHSPIDYLIQVRLNKARELLTHTEETINAIAAAIGYDDTFYFTRLFKKQTGLTPSEFRKQAQHDVPFSPVKESQSSMEDGLPSWYIDVVNENENQLNNKGEPTMFRMNKAAILLIGLSLLLAACGGGTNSANSTHLSSSTTPQTSSAPQLEKSSNTGHAETKTVNTIFGDIEIPVRPDLIAAIQYVSNLLAVGVKPTASTTRVLENPYFEGLKEGIEVVGGSSSDISFEKLIKLEPQLIVLMTSDKNEYEQYSKIAPTIPIPYGSFDSIEEEVTFFGQLLDRTEEADAWIEQYKQRITVAKEKIQQVIMPNETFSIFEWSDKNLSLFGEQMGRGGIALYRNLGLTMPAIYAKDLEKEGSYRKISLEVLEEFAGDYIILTTNKTLEEVEADSIWSRIAAVKNKKVYIWPNQRSYFNDPLSVLLQTEELADWLLQNQKNL